MQAKRFSELQSLHNDSRFFDGCRGTVDSVHFAGEAQRLHAGAKRLKTYAVAMREISLITGQLHRAIYNLNAQTRREADQKFEAGLRSAPDRTLRKVLEQFSASLAESEVSVRQRAASLLSRLMADFDALPESAQTQSMMLIEQGIADPDPRVREATVESYSLLLKRIENDALPESGDVRQTALERLLEIAITDIDEIVREAAAIGVGIQKSQAVQNHSVAFLLANATHRKFRRSCRAIESLAEFPQQVDQFETRLAAFIDHSDHRIRQAGVNAATRLAKLDACPDALVPDLTRRIFDGQPTVAAAASRFAKAWVRVAGRRNPDAAQLIKRCVAMQIEEGVAADFLVATNEALTALHAKQFRDRRRWLENLSPEKGGDASEQETGDQSGDLENEWNLLMQTANRCNQREPTLAWVAGKVVQTLLS